VEARYFFHADGQTDGQTGMMKLIFVFRNLFIKLPKNDILGENYSKAAFRKLWSADHKCFSGSALLVLLDWTLVQKRQKK